MREDESIIDDVLTRGASVVPRLDPAIQGAQAVSATMTNASTYSLKKRVGETIAREEISLIGEVLRKTNWNRRKAADVLEISYRSLLYKIKEYGLSASEL